MSFEWTPDTKGLERKRRDNHFIAEIKTVTLSSNKNDFMVLFKIGLSRVINRLYLRSDLNLLEFTAKISK